MSGEKQRRIDERVEDLPDYRPLGILGYLALVLALPGALAILNLALLIFPVLALTLALFAWRQSATFPGNVGRRPAQVAIALSLFLICLAITNQTLNVRHEYQYAIACAEHWIELLRGESPREAYLLTLAPNLRPRETAGEVPKMVGQANRAAVLETEDDFFRRQEIITLADPDKQLDLIAYSQQKSNSGRTLFRLMFRIHNPDIAGHEQIASIDIQSLLAADGSTYWQVGACQLIDPSRKRGT